VVDLAVYLLNWAVIMPPALPYTLLPLGDQAITISFGSCISPEANNMVLSVFHYLQKNPVSYLIEAVPAYTTISLFFDGYGILSAGKNKSGYAYMKDVCEAVMAGLQTRQQTGNHFDIPVCYEAAFAPDIHSVAAICQVSVAELIRLHTAVAYRVYMLGFLPGFPYLGMVDDKIQVPRKQQPQQVAAGSVALAGQQTGIYPLASPGGWQVIGRTPVPMFRPWDNNITHLQPGDTVKFISINRHEYNDYQSRFA
jgi:inhibitor of KinA